MATDTQESSKNTSSLLPSFFKTAFTLFLLSGATIAAQPALAFPVHVATSPENTLPLTLSAIQSAHDSILLNVYELASPEIAQALIDQINRGVHVEILQEGQPVGGVAASARGLQSQILNAMDSHPGDRYVEMRRPEGGKRRFRYDHAKYIVVDQKFLLLGSENYASGGQPDPGSRGNRGWEVLVEDAKPAQWFARTFEKDSDPTQPDIHDLLGGHTASITSITGESEPTPVLATPENPVFDASNGKIVVSPDNSLQGILGLIQSAQQTLDIEEMSFNSNWRGTPPDLNGIADQGFNEPFRTAAAPVYSSPMVGAILAAAKRGVKVRILLNDERAFCSGHHSNLNLLGNLAGETPSTPPMNIMEPSSCTYYTTNRKTVNKLMDMARSEGLPIEARIANLKAMGVSYIHNKGIIVDGDQTMISSINWTQNSVENNREAALVLTSSGVAQYYEKAFTQDWQRSESGNEASSFLNLSSASHSLSLIQNKTSQNPPMEIAKLHEDTFLAMGCPQKLKATAKIGELSVDDETDPSFKTLSHRTLSGIFTQDRHYKRKCILLGPKDMVIEIQRNSHGGGFFINLEGYTSASKPFAIRGTLPDDYNFSGERVIPLRLDADLMMGSIHGGGRKHHLGAAVLSIE